MNCCDCGTECKGHGMTGRCQPCSAATTGRRNAHVPADPSPKSCGTCGDEFARASTESIVDWNTRRFCSRRCAARSQGRRAPEARFWAKVDKTDTCWLWTASKNREGYGKFWDGERYVLAHRFAYEQLVDLIPAGLVIDHLCRVTGCVRPEHLEAVTDAVNRQRADAARVLVSDAQRRAA